MNSSQIDTLRHASRKLVRELGIVQLDKSLAGPTAQHCHALVEIGHKPGITVSELASLLLLSVSAASRLAHGMFECGFIEFQDSVDKREKTLYLSSSGQSELKNIDSYSNAKVQGAFAFLSREEQDQIVTAIEKYSQALESSRKLFNNIKILTLSTSRTLRKQIVAMVENIQKDEFQIPVTDEINSCILKAEDDFYYNNSYNFWYAVDETGSVIGCVGLKKLNGENGEIKKLFVEKQYRGKGVAQKLMAVVLKAASKHDFRTLWLGTVDKLQAAHRFYSKYGFVQANEKKLPKEFIKCPVDTLFFSGLVSDIASRLK